MRLRLVSQTDANDPADKGWRLLERGELTLGRDPKCHWPLSDPERRISKVHCRIRRDATGFTLTDESTNGLTVDRKELAQGQTVRLEKGSVIAFCGQRFTVEITGEVEPDWRDPEERFAPADEAPSITAILSDISPGGTQASGMLPGAASHRDWIEALGETDGAARSEPAASRPEIGWHGAPNEAITGSGFGGLPEDWDSDAGTASRAEHRIATSTRMRVPKAAGEEPHLEPSIPAASGPYADEAASVFFAEAGLRGPLSDPLTALKEAGREHRAMRGALAEIGRALTDIADETGAEPFGPFDAKDAAFLAAHHRVLLSALRALLDETDALAPHQLELKARLAEDGAKGLAARLPVPGRAERAFVDQHKRAYEGVDGSSPRSRFARALGADPNDPAADDFEELSAQAPRDGDRA